MPIWLCVWLLVLPFGCLAQPVETQVLLGFAAATLVVGRRFGSKKTRTRVSVFLFTPLHVLCLLFGNEDQLALVGLALVAPLAMAG